MPWAAVEYYAQNQLGPKTNDWETVPIFYYGAVSHKVCIYSSGPTPNGVRMKGEEFTIILYVYY